MKNLFLLIIVAMILPLAFVSCQTEDSSDVNQDKIYVVYELFYNANTDKTVAICRLRFGGPTGTLLELTDPANVTFNGDVLPYSIAYTGHAKEYAGKVESGTFLYTNVDGDVFTNATPTMDTIAHPAAFDTLDKSSAYTYTWQGNALGASERVNLFIGSWTWGQDALFSAAGTGSTNIVMGITQMANLAVGSSTVYVDRKNETTISEGTSEGGLIRSVYRPLNIQITVIE